MEKNMDKNLKCIMYDCLFTKEKDDKLSASFKKKVKILFPPMVGSRKSLCFYDFGLKILRKTFKNSTDSWLPHDGDKKLLNDINKIPEDGLAPYEVVSIIAKNFFQGVPNWRSPKLQYNICAPVNIVSQAVLSLSQELNVHNISTDFAGNCLLAEEIISEMMADLVDLPKDNVRGIFSFGGTASNMYAMKLAINKAVPNAGNIGVPPNIYIMITENAHFSHKTVADWLGIGIDRVIQIKSDNESRSIVRDAEIKARSVIEKGGIIAGFQLNGGPFYDFAVDDINAFVGLRSKLIKDYNLSFTPNIHVDSVIGWVWLMFNKYNFDLNPLKIPSEILDLLKKQFERIYQVKYADSWGVDFHKGLGGCPTPCGLFVCNNKNDLLLLSKKQRGICDMHHLGNDWSVDDPSDITLETSRSAGVALAAVASMLSMGKNDLRMFLANQIYCTKLFRDFISNEKYFLVGNPKSLGFNTMVLISPNNEKNISWNDFVELIEKNEQLLDDLNKEVKSFYEFCLNKDKYDAIKRLGCSFSKSFYKTKSGKNVSGLKYCFVSPHTNLSMIKKEINRLKEQFIKFRILK